MLRAGLVGFAALPSLAPRMGAPFVAPIPAVVCAPSPPAVLRRSCPRVVPPPWVFFCAAPVRHSPRCAVLAWLRPGARGAPAPYAPPGSPPGSPARRLVRRCAAPRALASADCPAALPSLRCGLPVRSPLLRLRRGLVQRVAPPGPPRLLCGAGLPPGGLGGCSPPFFRLPPGRCLRAVRLRPACCAPLRRCCAVGGVLPCAPRPPPPLGAPGARCPFGWASPPAAWVALLAPLSRLPPRAPRAPGTAFSARFTVLKLSTGY